MVLSRVRPGRILRSNKSIGSGRGIFRMALVALQFTVAIALITSTIVLYKQGQYLASLDPGFDKSNIMVFRFGGEEPHEDGVRFADALQNMQGVISAGLSGAVPSDQTIGSNAVESPRIPGGDTVSIRPINVGFGFFETYGISPTAGRVFDEQFQTDRIPIYGPTEGTYSGGVVLNESAVKRLGFSDNDDALGEVLKFAVGLTTNVELAIIGIVPNFMFDSAHEPIQPHIFYYLPFGVGSLSVKVNPADLNLVKQQSETLWREMFPASPMNRTYLEDMMYAQYQTELVQQQVLTAFSVLTVLVACLGLFGLAAFMAQRRVREVGVRKVMGASSGDIVQLFIMSFSKPVIVANLLAWPVTLILMNKWLERFAYRIDLDYQPFLLASILAIGFAMMTVGGRVYRAARNNPILALRQD